MSFILRPLIPHFDNVASSAGYPLIHYFTSSRLGRDGWNSVTTNETGQIPDIGNFGLIDKDTPTDLYSIPSNKDGREMVLVFSDEFNKDGRTFYPGDDPYWEAVDLHYWVFLATSIIVVPPKRSQFLGDQ